MPNSKRPDDDEFSIPSWFQKVIVWGACAGIAAALGAFIDVQIMKSKQVELEESFSALRGDLKVMDGKINDLSTRQQTTNQILRDLHVNTGASNPSPEAREGG